MKKFMVLSLTVSSIAISLQADYAFMIQSGQSSPKRPVICYTDNDCPEGFSCSHTGTCDKDQTITTQFV